MKVAFLHLDFSGGPTERNLQKISAATEKAAKAGANWVITPEMALQGYFFVEKQEDYQQFFLPLYPFAQLAAVAASNNVTLFLGSGEYVQRYSACYNSCFAVGPDGKLIGVQRKISGHRVGAEAWSTKAKRVRPLQCANLRVGILICSDSWYVKNAETARALNVDLIIVPAAWNDFDCGGGMPEDAWCRCSRVSGVPVWVCNQTGSGERMKLTSAKSAVIVGGKTLMSYSGDESILLFDWNEAGNVPMSDAFTIIPCT